MGWMKPPGHPDAGSPYASMNFGGSGGGSGGGNTTTTTVQQADPWSGQQPHLRAVYERAAGYANENTPLEFFPGQTVADFSPETLQAFDLQSQRAVNGSPLDTAAQDQAAATLGGDYLSAGNPNFSAMMDRVAADVTPRINANFAEAGRYGSGAHANAMADALTDAGSALAYQDYGRERENQVKAMFGARSLSDLEYRDAAALSEIGAAKETLAQQKLNTDIERFNFDQMRDWSQLGLYNQFITGNVGGTVTGTTEQQLPAGNRLGGAVGGGLAGGGLGYLLGGGQGALLGAGAGGLLGGFG